LQASELDLQELNFRVHAQLVLLQAEDVRVEGRSAGGVLRQEQFSNPGFSLGLFVLEGVNLLFEGVNLS
jgi:hypothetical protein